jgi:hypothetical protein
MISQGSFKRPRTDARKSPRGQEDGNREEVDPVLHLKLENWVRTDAGIDGVENAVSRPSHGDPGVFASRE